MTDQAPPSGANEAWLPEVPGFTVLRRIGSGGYSTVFEAVQQDIGAPVALKVLEGAYDERGRARFERECQSMGRLRDERGVVSVYSAAYTTDRRPVIVMAYLPGGSLAERIKSDGPMGFDEVLAVATEICAALGAAHQSGIFHRDIKPENILIDRHGKAALTDFGIATLAGEASSTETAASLTPSHAPPERYLTDPHEVDAVRADIYSLASTLYALLAGSPPHGTTRDGGIAALIDRILDEPPLPLTRSDLPPQVVPTLLRGLAKDPTDRFESAQALLESLADPEPVDRITPAPLGDPAPTTVPVVQTAGHDPDLDVTRRRERVPPPPPVVPPEVVVAASPAGEPRSSVRRPRRRIVAVFAIVVVALGAGAIWFVNRDASTAAPAGPCAKGTTWTQQPSAYPDGTVIGTFPPERSRVALIAGGARFSFSGPVEYEEMNFPPDGVKPVSAAEYYSVGERPRDGLLFKATAADGSGDHYFYSAAGAVFPVRDLAALASVGISAGDAIVVPRPVIDRVGDAANVPKGGTVIEVAGTKQRWLIDGASRRRAPRLCAGATVVIVPNDPHILDGISPLYG